MKYLGIILKTTMDERDNKTRRDAIMSEKFDHRVSAEEWIYFQEKNIERRNKVLGPRIRTAVNDTMVIAVDEMNSSQNYYEFLASLIINYRN